MGKKAKEWVLELVHTMGYSSCDELPEVVRENPLYFVFFPGSALFAQQLSKFNLAFLYSKGLLCCKVASTRGKCQKTRIKYPGKFNLRRLVLTIQDQPIPSFVQKRFMYA